MSDRGEPLFDAGRWRRLRALRARFDALPPAERAAAVRDAITNDPSLAADIDALESAERFDTEAFSATIGTLAAGAMPERVGPFRPLRRLGAGGMGVVYLAERTGSDFTHRVALKLLDSAVGEAAQLAARERRILAALTHPNITAFVDAGREGERAWLAMEYVDGEPLLECCRSRDLDIRERMQLFDQMAAAVAHAHAHLVVHRDLKPANVLVTAAGAVKLLDFGIALALADEDGTTAATRVFTPEYAAPEQLRGERATTATDIHALGLILFELVSGERLATLQRPHGEEWTQGDLVRFATAGAGATGEAKRIAPRLLRGDLGRIIACALAPRPEQRYASVTTMREDVRRWLEHRPLSLARPRAGYVMARFVRRNRAAVAVGTAAIVALVAAAGFAFWQGHVARQMALRAEHAKTFLAGLLTDADPFNSKRSDKSKLDLLRDAARRLDTELPDAPAERAELRGIVARALIGMGEPSRAREIEQRSVDELRAAFGPGSLATASALQTLAIASETAGDIDAARSEVGQAYATLKDAGSAWRAERISAMTTMARLANRANDYAQAQRWHEAAMSERIAASGPQSADVAMDLMNLASDALYQERYADAETLAQRAKEMLVATAGPRHARMVYVANVLGLAEAGAGHFEASFATLGGAIALADAILPPGASMRSTLRSALGSAKYQAGDFAAACAMLGEAAALFAREKSPTLGIVEMNLGQAELFAGSGDPVATLERATADLASSADRVAGSPKYLAVAQAALGAARARAGDRATGERVAREARATLLAGPFADSVVLADIDEYLAGIIEMDGRVGQARALREESHSRLRRVLGDAHPRVRQAAAGRRMLTGSS